MSYLNTLKEKYHNVVPDIIENIFNDIVKKYEIKVDYLFDYGDIKDISISELNNFTEEYSETSGDEIYGYHIEFYSVRNIDGNEIRINFEITDNNYPLFRDNFIEINKKNNTHICCLEYCPWEDSGVEEEIETLFSEFIDTKKVSYTE